MKKVAFTLLLLTIAGLGYSQDVVTGKVTCGKSNISNVMVTDGFSCVNTDANGDYSFVMNPDARFVYISTPAGYLTATENTSIPVFYQKVEKGKTQYDFNLIKNKKSDIKHTVFVQADVQVAEEGDLEKYKLIAAEARDYLKKYSKTDVFGLDCGDMVSDMPQLYPGYIENCGLINIPIYRTMGNHDMAYYGRTFETSQHRYENMFGPTYYSFNKGKAHYIMIDNSFYIGRDYFYMGYIDEKTYAWIEKDLKNVPAGNLVIIAMHIPTMHNVADKHFAYNGNKVADETVNRGALYEMLKPYKAHIITGHMHENSNVVITPTLMEHNTGSACGTWYQLGICVDGTPSGYAVYEIDGTDIKWHYKGVGYSQTYQMKVYGLNESKQYPNAILANVWNYDPQWKVEWLENGKLIGPMEQCEALDPYMSAQCEEKSKFKYSWIGPVQTRHMFKAVPNDPKAKIEVRVTDRFGNVYKETVKSVK